MTASPIPMAYAPPPPWYRRRRVRRWVLVGTLMLAAAAGWFWGRAVWRLAMAKYWVRQCMIYTVPAETVVFDGDAAGAEAVTPTCLKRLSSSLLGTLGGGEGNLPVLFMHERIASTGERRLVIVVAVSTTVTPFMPIWMAGLIDPGSTFAPPKFDVPCRLIVDIQQMPMSSGPIRWFAGQADPADASHFTIRGEVEGRPVVVDGYLRNADTVELTARGNAPSGFSARFEMSFGRVGPATTAGSIRMNGSGTLSYDPIDLGALVTPLTTTRPTTRP